MPFPKANRRVRFWRRKWHKAKPGTTARSRAYRMLVLRKRQLERLIRRHPKAKVASVSPHGLVLIARFEGFSSKPYRDPVGVWTIGYGETRGIGPGTRPWSEPYARERLKVRVNRDYLRHVLALAASIGLELTQNEADALASLVYNCGPGILDRHRSLGRAIRTRNRSIIAGAFLVYRYAGGRVLPGLERRRREERALFLHR